MAAPLSTRAQTSGSSLANMLSLIEIGAARDLPGQFGKLVQPPYNGVSIATRNASMPTFEESLKKLEVIVEQLEKGDLALEDSLKLFEEGVGLSAACKKELDEAEGKVQLLIKQRDGSLKAEPFLNEKPS
ncbi:MAG TPA: exodeoxyribonuclease VII small subunit [Acidobacteriaceae bacterium]